MPSIGHWNTEDCQCENIHNHFKDMVFGHHCLRCPQRRTLLSSRTFLLRMGSFPTGISICCLCLKHWHFDEVPWGKSGKYHFTAAKQICAEYETTDKNAVVCIYDCHTFLASPTHCNCLVADHEVHLPPHNYWLYVILMNYTNSIVNPVLYALRISEFRSSLLLLCLRRPVLVRDEERGKQRDNRSDLSAHALQLETSKEEIIDTKFWNGGMASSSCSISNRTRSLTGPKLLLFGDRPWNKWQ